MRQITFLLLAAISLTTSCRRTEQPPKILYNGSYSIVLDESNSYGDKQLAFRIATGDSFNCTNFQVATESNKNNNEITINLDGVLPDQTCHPGRDVARGGTYFTNLAIGPYTLIIRNAGKAVRGTLTIADDRFAIDYAGGNNASFTDVLLHRVQKNTIWGTIEFTDSASLPLLNDFMDSLHAYGATDYTGDTGKYSGFTVIPGSTYTHPGDGFRIAPYRHFICNYSGEVTKLSELVSNYLELHRSSLTIRIDTWDGRVFGSYVAY